MKLGVNGGLNYVATTFSNFFMCFVQIGLVEEVAKAITFFLATYYLNKTNKMEEHPFAIMFYMCMVSLGFGIVENVKYIWEAVSIGYSGEMVGVRRMVSAVLAHMGFGLTMGYFFGLTKKEVHGNEDGVSIVSVWYRHKRRLRNGFLIFLGIFNATILHGTYDFNLTSTRIDEYFLPIGNTYLFHLPTVKLLVLIIMVNYIMSKRLLNLKQYEKHN
jgi:RsiW-degrading membrane proteinase PrsW (M82 family)